MSLHCQRGLFRDCIGIRQRRTSTGRTKRPFDTVHRVLRESEGAGARPTIWVGFQTDRQAVRFSIQMWLILCPELMKANCFFHFMPRL